MKHVLLQATQCLAAYVLLLTARSNVRLVEKDATAKKTSW